MTEKQITHIREDNWAYAVYKVPDPNPKQTMCGDESNSISFEHARDGWHNKHKHLESLEICDDCWEEFKTRMPREDSGFEID